jgi:DNA-directed RNA polymerase subunit RPC12/RpoP
MTARPALPACPSCGSTDAVRIVYGYPTAETAEAAERGEVELGGCVIGQESPDYVCRRCGAPLPWVADD